MKGALKVASEPKPFASLSSGLLARKGAARPAMRPQGFGQGGASLEDLGWNDMGFEPPKPAEAARDSSHDAFGEAVVEHPRAVHPSGLTPVQSPVHTQHAEIADRFGAEEAEEVEETFEAVEAERCHRKRTGSGGRPDPGPGSGSPSGVPAAVGSWKQGQGRLHSAARCATPS